MMKYNAWANCIATNLFKTVAVVAAILFGSLPAMAEYPERPITIMVGFAAGGGNDLYARMLADGLRDELGQPVQVVNRPGAAGSIAGQDVLSADSDGYTLYVTNAGTMISKELIDGENSAFRSAEDFVVLGAIGRLETAVMVPVDSPYGSLAELIAFSSENPDVLRWAHAGRGSYQTLGGFAFLSAAEGSAMDVPFRGGALARGALVARQVDFTVAGLQSVNGYESEIMPLAVMNTSRDPNFENVPTLSEVGMPTLDWSGPIMVFVREGVPADIVERLSLAVEAVAQSEDFAAAASAAGLSARYLSPDQSVERMTDLRENLDAVVRSVFDQ